MSAHRDAIPVRSESGKLLGFARPAPTPRKVVVPLASRKRRTLDAASRRMHGVACALCEGDGDVVNPGNADPGRAVEDWLAPVVCPRCGGTGVDPKP